MCLFRVVKLWVGTDTNGLIRAGKEEKRGGAEKRKEKEKEDDNNNKKTMILVIVLLIIKQNRKDSTYHIGDGTFSVVHSVDPLEHDDDDTSLCLSLA